MNPHSSPYITHYSIFHVLFLFFPFLHSQLFRASGGIVEAAINNQSELQIVKPMCREGFHGQGCPGQFQQTLQVRRPRGHYPGGLLLSVQLIYLTSRPQEIFQVLGVCVREVRSLGLMEIAHTDSEVILQSSAGYEFDGLEAMYCNVCRTN